MKVAVVGANGFIGTRLVEMFYLGGRHEVVPIVRKPSSLALPARFAVDWRVGDCLEVASLTRALEGCDAVVHAALGDARQIRAMPAILAAAAAAANVRRVVYLSSAAVYGKAPAPGTDESTPLHTRHSFEYDNAKVAAEHSFFAECRKRELAGYALRPGVVYGPRSRWIADLALELRAGKACLLGDGNGICNGIYADNLVEAVDGCLRATAGEGQPYLVGDGETMTWAEFYGGAAAELGIAAHHIHSVDAPPFRPPTTRERVGSLVAQPWVQWALPAIPDALKRGTKALLAAFAPAPLEDSWALPAVPNPELTAEMAALQSCAWKFPHTRAAAMLGYRPSVTFAEGMRRSIAWWRFAGGELRPIK